MANPKDLTLEQEREAFDAALPRLLDEHEGQFVLFKCGAPLGFFESYDDAYSAGLDQFGLRETFLVQQVRHEDPEPANLSWLHGIAFEQL